MNREDISLDANQKDPIFLQRHIHAWIPSEGCEQVFSSLPVPDKRFCYTMPGLLHDGPLGDPIANLASKCELEEVVRPDFNRSMDGLKQLITTGNFRMAVDLTGNLLSECGQGFGSVGMASKHSLKSLQLWTVRFQLLASLKMTTLLLSELDAFGDLDAPDLYFQYYPEIYPGQRGSLVPFSLRLLHAESTSFSSTPVETCFRLHKLIDSISLILSNLSNGRSEDNSIDIDGTAANESINVWKNRLRNVNETLARTFLTAKDYHLASMLYSKLTTDKNGLEMERLLSKLNLQLGDQKQTSKWLDKNQSELPDEMNSTKKSILDCHEAYQEVFYGNYSKAYQHFIQAFHSDECNIEAVNNAAVCLLYLGRLSDAIRLLEKSLQDHPRSLLSEPMVLNLASLYELATTANSSVRKCRLLQLVTRHRGDSFSASCLKLV